MRIKKIKLKNYRNYNDIELNFNDNLNIIIGDNAQGKTNLLESIYVLAVTKSFLSISDRNLIKFNNKFAMIKGFLECKNNNISLEKSNTQTVNFEEQKSFLETSNPWHKQKVYNCYLNEQHSV